MKKFFIFLFIFLIIVFPALKGECATSLVNGIVRNIDNLEPVPHAKVYVGNDMAITDSYGEFTITLPMTGKYVIRVDSAKYKEAYKNITILNGMNNINFKLVPKLATSKLFGTIYDKILLRPVRNAEVSLDGVAVRTSLDGQYSFNNVEPGDRWISVYCAGYLVTTNKILITEQNKKLDVFLLHEGNYTNVSGIILDRVTSEPIHLAVLELGDRRAVTDEKGFFYIENILPGKYSLKIKADGFYQHSESLNLTEGQISIKIYLEHYNVEDEIRELKSQMRDYSKTDWMNSKKKNNIKIIKEMKPDSKYAQKIELSSKKDDLEARNAYKRKILRKHDKVNRFDHLVKGKVYLSSTREYLGFISFILNTNDKKIRNVSLRSVTNTKGLLLTKARYKFTKRYETYKCTIRLEQYEGNANIKLMDAVSDFKIYLQDDEEEPLGMTDRLR